MWLKSGLVFLLSAEVLIAQVRQQEFCQWETFNATCPKNDVILITSAFYGRMKVGRCLTVDYHVGCHGDVTETVASRCSGRHACSVTVPDSELFRLQPCRKDLVAYFEATYRCIHISGISGSSPKESAAGRSSSSSAPECNGSGVSVVPPSASSPGYLASFGARHPSGPGSQRCPWVLRAPRGQRINVTLHDFTAPRIPSSSDPPPLLLSPRQPPPEVACHPLAVLLDPGSGSGSGVDHVIRTCDVRQKRRLAYTSHDSTLRVFIANGTSEDVLFLLRYQVTGCANLLNLSKDAWASRSGENLLVSCNHSLEKWHLVCRGTEWIGSYGNCSSAITPHTEEARVNQQQFSIGLLVAIAIGAIVGVAIGCIFLLMVFVFRKRFNRQRSVNEAVLMDLYKSRDNIYKTIDLRSAQLPPEMTCMLDVIGVTPSSSAGPGPGAEGLRASPCGRLPGRASVAPLGPHEEVYFSEELLRQTLGRCTACSGGSGGPRPDGTPRLAPGPHGAPGEPPRSLERGPVYADAVVNRQQVALQSTFFSSFPPPSSSASSDPRQMSSRGLSIPHESSSSPPSSFPEEKLYEKTTTNEGRTNQIGTKTDLLSHVTREEPQLKKL